MRDKYFLFRKDNTSYPVHGLRHCLTIKLPDIFMPVGAITISFIFMQAEIK